MKEKEEKTLEFDKFRKLLVDKAGSVLGKELAEKLRPAEDFDDALRLLDETEEAFILLQSGAMPPVYCHITREQAKTEYYTFKDINLGEVWQVYRQTGYH